MLLFAVLLIFNVAVGVLGHGHVRFISVDGKLHWGYNPERDDKFSSKRIAFGYNQKGSRRFAIVDQTSPDIACNHGPTSPALIAPARAGSKVNFMWSPWFISHKGPIVTYMAPYEGPVENVDLNKLKFFKISEIGLRPDNRTWAVDEMMANGNITSATIPHNIKSGMYVLRHELIALHYATEDSLYHMKPEKLLGPQHYIQCFNIEVLGGGDAEPEGITFPGAYRPFKQEPGLYFDIWRNVHPYPIPGPELYIPQDRGPQLEDHEYDSLPSPTGDVLADMKYFGAMTMDIINHDVFTLNVNKQHLGYGPNLNMSGPPEGSVPPGAAVDGFERW